MKKNIVDEILSHWLKHTFVDSDEFLSRCREMFIELRCKIFATLSSTKLVNVPITYREAYLPNHPISTIFNQIFLGFASRIY